MAYSAILDTTGLNPCRWDKAWEFFFDQLQGAGQTKSRIGCRPGGKERTVCCQTHITSARGTLQPRDGDGESEIIPENARGKPCSRGAIGNQHVSPSFRAVSPGRTIVAIPRHEGNLVSRIPGPRAPRSCHSGEAPRPVPESLLPSFVSCAKGPVNSLGEKLAFSAMSSTPD